MKLLKTSLVIVVTFFAVVPANATGVWTSWAVPTTIQTARDGVFVTMPGTSDPGSCGHPGQFYLLSNDSGSGVRTDQFISIVMTAIAANTKVRFFVDGCYTDSFVSGTGFNAISYSVAYKEP